MKTPKNFEALFLVIAATATFATYAAASTPLRAASPAAVVHAVDAAAPMQVVVVKAKRLSAAEKAQLGE